MMKQKSSKKLRWSVAIAISATLSMASLGHTSIVLNATSTGWYDSNGHHNASNQNYVVGNNDFWRDYFNFNLSSLGLAPGQQITSATLRVSRVFGGNFGQTVNYGLFDVNTPSASLVSSNSGVAGQNIYNDLGTGLSYGSFAVSDTAGSPNDLLSFTLNSAGITNINSAIGQSFAIGGSLGSTNSWLFGGSNGTYTRQLVLETGPATSPVPEPSTYAMMGLMMMGVIIVARRKKAAQMQLAPVTA